MYNLLLHIQLLITLHNIQNISSIYIILFNKHFSATQYTVIFEYL